MLVLAPSFQNIIVILYASSVLSFYLLDCIVMIMKKILALVRSLCSTTYSPECMIFT